MQAPQSWGDHLRCQRAPITDSQVTSSSSIRSLNRICQMLDLGKESRQQAGQFSSFDREVQTTRSPIEQANPECGFQLFNLPAQGELRDVERLGRLPKNFRPRRFPGRTLIVAIERVITKRFHSIALFYSNCS
jgi:hypothetical protein